MRTSLRRLLGAALLVAACSSEPQTPNGDAATQDRAKPADASPDAAGDNGPDAAAEVGADADDAGPDVAAEGGADAASDAEVDAAPDAAEDAAPDASPEVGADAALDATPPPDAAEDAALDASADSGPEASADVATDLGADAPAMDAPAMDAPAVDVIAPDAVDASTTDAVDAAVDADAAGVDPSFAGVVVLLHMEGPAGGRSFVDVGGHTVRADGAASIGTTARFGAGGAAFDGSGAQLVVAPRARELVFEGADAFTLEAWVNGTGTVFSCDSFGLVMAIKDARTLYVWVNGVLPWDFTGTAAGTVPEGWHHVALSYDGATYRWFIDGAVTLERAGRLSSQSNDYLVVGGYSGGVQPWFNGSIDEVRVTRGVARYTGSFAPPTAPFPDR